MSTDPGLVAPGTNPGPVERPRTAPVLFVIVGAPIVVVFGLAVVFTDIPTLMVLGFGGLGKRVAVYHTHGQASFGRPA